MYSVFRQLGNGEFIQIASRDQLEQAVQLVVALKALWPKEGRFVVRDSNGKDVYLTERPAI